MSTDLYICISSDKYSNSEINKDIDGAIEFLLKFENRFSRFIKGNELYEFNHSIEIKVSEELYQMLKISREYYSFSERIFDPAILPYLIDEGYEVSMTKGFVSTEHKDIVSNRGRENNKRYMFKDLRLSQDHTVVKPLGMKIDLGGIGKGYAVDKVKEKLVSKYSDYCISLGGDMFLAGKDKKNGYDYWAIEIEDPFKDQLEMPTLVLSDISVATSGVYKRNWYKSGNIKHHLIDPRTRLSSNSSIISVTVISNKTVESDILAKVVLIMGLEKGIDYCDNNKIAAIIFDDNKKLYYTENAKKYVWKS